MKRKICVRSMFLGAGIMAVGITMGQFVTPNIPAQNNGVFDKIQCREIEVIDENDKVGIVLKSDVHANRILIYDLEMDARAIILQNSEEGNQIELMRVPAKFMNNYGVRLFSSREVNLVSVSHPQKMADAIELAAGTITHSMIRDRTGAAESGGYHELTVRDYKDPPDAWSIVSSEHGNFLWQWLRKKQEPVWTEW